MNSMLVSCCSDIANSGLLLDYVSSLRGRPFVIKKLGQRCHALGPHKETTGRLVPQITIEGTPRDRFA